jgi:hypothetical protein
MTSYIETSTYPNSSCLLPHWQNSSQWCHSDSEELYLQNCANPPAGWLWKDRQVEYHWNREGYRAPNWESIIWPSVHVVMGCSFVLGVGIDENETLSHQLSLELGEPVINLGFQLASAQVIMYNTMRMQELGWKPNTVTIIIPELSRMTYFEDEHVISLYPDTSLKTIDRTEDYTKFFQMWTNTPKHAELYARMAIKGAQSIWHSQGVPVVLRHFRLQPKEQSIMAPCLATCIDRGRDLQLHPVGHYYGHPGPLTQKIWARDLADEIRSLE